MTALYTFAALAVVFVVCVLVQFFLAGLAVFVSPANWLKHLAFVHYFQALPLLMLLSGWLGKAPKRLLWQSAALIGLIYVQYFTANMRALSAAAAAVHPVTALPLAGLAFMVAQDAWRLVSARRLA